MLIWIVIVLICMAGMLLFMAMYEPMKDKIANQIGKDYKIKRVYREGMRLEYYLCSKQIQNITKSKYFIIVVDNKEIIYSMELRDLKEEQVKIMINDVIEKFEFSEEIEEVSELVENEQDK